MTGPAAPLARIRSRRRQGPPAGEFDRRLLAPMVLGSVLNPVNSSMIAVALVPVGAAFGAPPAETAWLVCALYLATAVGQPVIGRLVDRYGPRRLYLIGTAVVGLAGLLGALAPSLGLLVAARVLLGLGTSAAYPAAMHLTRSKAERTGRESPTGVLTVLAVASQTVAVIGPTLGGVLIGVGGWRAVFAVNVPLSLACLVLGAIRLPAAVRRGRRDERDLRDLRDLRDQPDLTGRPGTSGRPEISDKPDRLDYGGIALFAAMLLALMLFLMKPRPAEWHLPVLAVAAAVAFAVRESRARNPFIDLRALAGNRPLIATYLRQLLGCTATYAFRYGFTQWLEEGRGLTATAGLVMLPLSLTALTVSAVTGRRPAVRGKLLAGRRATHRLCRLVGIGSA